MTKVYLSALLTFLFFFTATKGQAQCSSSSLNQPANKTVNEGTSTSAQFSGTADVFTWTNNNTSIGLAASGIGDIAPFTATNSTNAPITANVTVTPEYFTTTSVSGTTTGAQTMPSRTIRDGNASTCAAPKGYPGTSIYPGPFYYDSYTLSNPTPSAQCITVQYSKGNPTSKPSVAAYLNSFNPADVSQNYLADGGGVPVGTITFSFTLPAGQSAVLVVNDSLENTSSSYNLSYTNPAVRTQCAAGVKTFSITVNPTGISYPGSPFCQTGVGFVTLGASTPGGGTFSAPAGLHINNTTGVIYPASSTPGTYTVTYTYAGGSTTTSVTIIPLPKVAVGPVASVCQSDVSFKLPFAPANSAVSYSISADPTAPMPGFTPVVNATLPASDTITVAIPAGSAGGTYKFDISVKNAQGCVSPGRVVATLTVATPATTSISYPSPMCQTGEILPTRTGAAGGTYSSTTGLHLNSTTGLITPALSTPGTYTVSYTFTSASGCSFSVNTSVTITTLPRVSLGTVNSVCVGTSGATASLPYTVVSGSPVTYDLSAGSTNPMPNFTPVNNATLDPNTISVHIPAGTAAGTYSFNLYVKSAGGCVSPKYVFNVTVTGPCPVASPAYSRTINPVKNAVTEESTTTIAPNPVHRMLNIHTAMQGKMIVHITNAEGRMLLSNANFTSSYSFDMSGYAPGIYIVEVLNEKTGEIVRKKVVKE